MSEYIFFFSYFNEWISEQGAIFLWVNLFEGAKIVRKFKKIS